MKNFEIIPTRDGEQVGGKWEFDTEAEARGFFAELKADLPRDWRCEYMTSGYTHKAAWGYELIAWGEDGYGECLDSCEYTKADYDRAEND